MSEQILPSQHSTEQTDEGPHTAVEGQPIAEPTAASQISLKACQREAAQTDSEADEGQVEQTALTPSQHPAEPTVKNQHPVEHTTLSQRPVELRVEDQRRTERAV